MHPPTDGPGLGLSSSGSRCRSATSGASRGEGLASVLFRLALELFFVIATVLVINVWFVVGSSVQKLLNAAIAVLCVAQ